MDNSKYKIDSVKVAKFKYVDSYNSSYWNGKPREKIDITRVGLNADDYEDYQEYKIGEDKHNPFNKIEYYFNNNIPKNVILSDIEKFKQRYPKSDFAKLNKEVIYSEIIKEEEKLKRKASNPYSNAFYFKDRETSDDNILKYIKGYRKKYPNDGLFYACNDLPNNNPLLYDIKSKQPKIPTSPGKDINPNEYVNGNSKYIELTDEEVLQIIKGEMAKPRIDEPNKTTPYNKYLICSTSSEDPQNPLNRINYYYKNGTVDSAILNDIDEMQEKYPNEDFFKQDDYKILQIIHSKLRDEERSNLNPMNNIQNFGRDIFITHQKILQYIQYYRKKYPNDGLFYAYDNSLSSSPAFKPPQELSYQQIVPISPGEDINPNDGKKYVQLTDDQILQLILSHMETDTFISTSSSHPIEKIESTPKVIKQPFIDFTAFKKIKLSAEDINMLNSYTKDANTLVPNLNTLNSEAQALEYYIETAFVTGKNANIPGNVPIADTSKGNFKSPVTGLTYSLNKEDAQNRLQAVRGRMQDPVTLYNSTVSDRKEYSISVINKLRTTSDYKNYVLNTPDKEGIYTKIVPGRQTPDVRMSTASTIEYLIKPPMPKMMTDEEIYMYGYLKDREGKDVADQYIELIKDEVYLREGAKNANDHLDQWLDSNGDLKQDFFTYFNIAVTGGGDGIQAFFEKVNGLNPGEDGHMSAHEYEMLIIAQILAEKDSDAARLYNISESIGEILIPLVPAVALTIAGHPEFGATVFNALTSLANAGATRKLAIQNGADGYAGYAAGFLKGGTSFAINTFTAKFWGIGKDDIIGNIIHSGASRTISSFTNAIIDSAATGEPIDEETILQDSAESFATGIILSLVTQAPSIIKLKRKGGNTINIPISQKEKDNISNFFKRHNYNTSMMFILKKCAPIFFKTLSSEFAENLYDLEEYLENSGY